MPALILEQPIYLLLLCAHCLIGLFAAAIACSKGQNLGRWILIGLICGTPSLFMALFIVGKADKDIV